MYSTCIGLAAFGPIEEDPNRKIIAEVFKAVFDTCGREQYVAWPEGLARPGTNKLAAALRDDVNLVTRMGPLGVGAAWRVQFYDQRTMFEQTYRAFALRAG